MRVTADGFVRTARFKSIHRGNHPRRYCPLSYTNWKLPFLLSSSYLMSSDLSSKMWQRVQKDLTKTVRRLNLPVSTVMGSWKTASPIAFVIEMAPPFYVSIAECPHFQLGLPRLLLPQNVLADPPQRRPLRRHGRVLFLVTIATFTGTWIASIRHYQRCPLPTRNGCVQTTWNECYRRNVASQSKMRPPSRLQSHDNTTMAIST